MSLIDVARDTLKDLPISDILRERLSLALDQSAVFERQIGELQTKVGRLEAQLEIVRLDRDKVTKQLRELEELHNEEVRIEDTVEFRRGARTGGTWKPFCPKCHLPASTRHDNVMCSGACGWYSDVPSQVVHHLVATRLLT